MENAVDQCLASADASRFLSEFAGFLSEFGPRVFNDWELRVETWETDPMIERAAVKPVRFQADGSEVIGPLGSRKAANLHALWSGR